MSLQTRVQEFTHLGVDASTPPFLVDRVIFSHLVYLISIGVDLSAAIANIGHHHWILLGLNFVYLAVFAAGFYLNSRHQYLASRLLYLWVMILGLAFTGAITGPHLQNEHFLLVLVALSFVLLHPSERRHSIFFAFIGSITYFFLVNQSRVLLPIDPAPFPESDRYFNQVAYLVLYVLSLNAMSSAYAKASKVIEGQHQRLLEQARMSSAGMVARRVAHEINSPLTALELELYWVQRHSKQVSLDSELLDHLATVQRLSRRISVLVQGVNYLSRTEQSESPVVVPLAPLLESVMEIAADRIRQAEISVNVSLSRSLEVRCRPRAFSQVLLNLLNNSIDALEEQPPESRWIRISSESHGGVIEISVADGGPTPDPEIREKMFQSFFTTKPMGRATGLGLSVSRQVLRELGGDLVLDVTSPKTRFVVRLPRELGK